MGLRRGEITYAYDGEPGLAFLLEQAEDGLTDAFVAQTPATRLFFLTYPGTALRDVATVAVEAGLVDGATKIEPYTIEGNRQL